MIIKVKKTSTNRQNTTTTINQCQREITGIIKSSKMEKKTSIWTLKKTKVNVSRKIKLIWLRRGILSREID